MSLIDSITTAAVGGFAAIVGVRIVFAGFVTSISAPAGATIGVPIIMHSFSAFATGVSGIH